MASSDRSKQQCWEPTAEVAARGQTLPPDRELPGLGRRRQEFPDPAVGIFLLDADQVWFGPSAINPSTAAAVTRFLERGHDNGAKNLH